MSWTLLFSDAMITIFLREKEPVGFLAGLKENEYSLLSDDNTPKKFGIYMAQKRSCCYSRTLQLLIHTDKRRYKNWEGIK